MTPLGHPEAPLRRVLLRVGLLAIPLAPCVVALVVDRWFLHALTHPGTSAWPGTGHSVFQPEWAFVGLAAGTPLVVTCAVEAAAGVMAPRSWKRDSVAAGAAWLLAFGLLVVGLVQLTCTQTLVDGDGWPEASQNLGALAALARMAGARYAVTFGVITASVVPLTWTRLRGHSLPRQTVTVAVGSIVLASLSHRGARIMAWYGPMNGMESCDCDTQAALSSGMSFLLQTAVLAPLALFALDSLECAAWSRIRGAEVPLPEVT